MITATGNANVTNRTVENVNLTVKKGPGSDSIDLEDATIQYTAANAQQTLTYNTSNPDGINFTTSAVNGGDSRVLGDSGDRVQISLNVTAIERNSASGDDPGLFESESASIELVSQSGASTTFELNAPSVIDTEIVDV